MWIAKPLNALTQAEEVDWRSVLASAHSWDKNTPLAQTLEWGRAIEAVGGRPHLVFSPAEQVGGLIFAVPDSEKPGVHFECVNGPLLHWDNATASPRQLATFAMAVSKIDSQFKSLSLRPRWRSGQTELRLSQLPIPPFAKTRAATLQLNLQRSLAEIEGGFHLRLQRTLKISDQLKSIRQWEAPDEKKIRYFHHKIEAFAQLKGFSVPPPAWFQALTQPHPFNSLKFAIVTVQLEGAECQLLIALQGEEAYYLFGHELRSPELRAAVSPSALAHRLAIRKVHEAGAKLYDFNGYVENVPLQHPYAGICQFKAQFGAELMRYEVPEFKIE